MGLPIVQRIVIVICLLICAGSACAATPGDEELMLGVNLAGAEFAPQELPGIEGRNWSWPSLSCIDYWHKAGIRLVRLPFKWERLQPTLMKDFDPAYAAGLAKVVGLLRERDMQVILDVHNYGQYRKQWIGSPDVPFAAFQDLWTRLATKYKDEPHIWGYGLMNEPDATKGWREAAQYGIDGVRAVDRKTRILVANDYPGWAATRANLKPGADLVAWAAQGMAFGDPSMLKDPSDRLVWELHFYFDHDASGTYRKTYAEEIARKDGPEQRVRLEVGVHRMKPFVEWLKHHRVKGFIGEYSAPDSDPRWLEILEHTLAFMRDSKVSSTYWAGGQSWPTYRADCIERSGWAKDVAGDLRLRDRPQLEIMRKFMPAR